MQSDIQQKWFFSQQPGDVWEYLTNPELIGQWLMKTDFQPIVGHKFRFMFDPKPGSIYEGIVNCEVIEVVPLKRLSYTWNGSTKNNGRKFNSTIVWTLIPKADGTELQLRHSGFEMMDDFLNHSSGWEGCLKRFEEYINKSLI